MFFLVLSYGISTTFLQILSSLRFPIHQVKGVHWCSGKKLFEHSENMYQIDFLFPLENHQIDLIWCAHRIESGAIYIKFLLEEENKWKNFLCTVITFIPSFPLLLFLTSKTLLLFFLPNYFWIFNFQFFYWYFISNNYCLQILYYT